MDLSTLSDEQLMALHKASQPDLSSLTDDQLLALHDSAHSKTPTSAEAQRSMLIRGGMPRIYGMNPVDAVMGIKDPLAGAAQLATRAYEALSGNSKPRQAVESANNAVDQTYDRVMQPDLYSDAAASRGMGQALATAPLTLGVKPAAGLMGRMTQGAGMGGATAALTPVNADGGDGYFQQKAAQAGIGAALGGAAVPVVEGAAKLGVNLINKAVDFFRARAPKATAASPRAVQQAVADALSDSGIDAQTVPRNVLATLHEQATQALQAGRPLDKAAVARSADFAALNMRPMAGQVTRDPTQFAFERNLAGVKDAGEPIAQRLGEQNQQLIGNVAAVRPASSVADKYGAGESAIGALSSLDKAMQGAITQAYDAARKTAGANAEVPLQPLAQRAGEVFEQFGEENVPGVVRRKLQDLGLFGGTQQRSFTVDGADKLRKAINANYDPANKVQAAALRHLLNGIDDSVGLMAEQGATIGPAAAAAFDKARQIAKSRFRLLDKVPALKAVAEGDAVPDNFFDRYVLRSNVTELEALKQLLQVRPPVLQDLRAQTVDYLKTAALNGKAEDMGAFSSAAYRKALAALGDRRLNALFSPDEIGQLNRVSRVAQYVMDPPVGAPVNASKTAPVLLDLANRARLLNNVPGLAWAARTLDTAAKNRQVQQALVAPVAAISQPSVPAISPDVATLLGRRTGIVGGGLLGLLAGGVQ